MKCSKSITKGNYNDLKSLSDSYELNNGKFNCKLTGVKLIKTSMYSKEWQLEVDMLYDENSNKEKFENDVKITQSLILQRQRFENKNQLVNKKQNIKKEKKKKEYIKNKTEYNPYNFKLVEVIR